MSTLMWGTCENVCFYTLRESLLALNKLTSISKVWFYQITQEIIKAYNSKLENSVYGRLRDKQN